MKKFALAAAILAAGATAANAVPTTLTGTSVGLPPGVSDMFNVFVNGTRAGGIVVTDADEAACSNSDSATGGCSFSTGAIVVGGITISPNMALSNQAAVFFEPGGGKISDLFFIDCQASRDTTTGLCIGAGNFTVETPGASGFVDYSTLVSLAASIGISIGYTGNELLGLGTAFPIGSFMTVTGNTDHLPIGANFVSRNDVPEPVSMSLFGAGIVGLTALRRRKKRA